MAIHTALRTRDPERVGTFCGILAGYPIAIHGKGRTVFALLSPILVFTDQVIIADNRTSSLAAATAFAEGFPRVGLQQSLDRSADEVGATIAHLITGSRNDATLLTSDAAADALPHARAIDNATISRVTITKAHAALGKRVHISICGQWDATERTFAAASAPSITSVLFAAFGDRCEVEQIRPSIKRMQSHSQQTARV
jgi:hypothetical protein